MANGLTTPITQNLTPKKPTINFPYPQPGQNLPLAPAAVQQPTSTLSTVGSVFDPNLSQQVVKQAQTKALQGTPTGTAGLVSQQTQKYLQDPTLGADPEAQKKLVLDQLARRQASDIEAMRQATGGTANLGFNVGELMSAQLQQRQEKTDVQRQLELDAQQAKQQQMLSALAVGKETVGMEQALQTGDINNLITAAGGALGFAELASKQDILLSEQDFTATQNALDQQYKLALQANDITAQKDILGKQLAFEAQQAKLGYEFTASQNDLNRILQTNLANLDATTQKEMVNLKAMVDKDLLMTEQDFAASEAELNRQFQDAMQKGDFAQANSMAIMLNQFDTIKMQKQQEWQSAENVAQNAFATQMQLTQNDFDKGMQYLKFEQDLAASEKDFEKQKILQDKQNELQLQMLTQNFTHDEKMAILDSELQAAKSTQDFEKQKQLLTFSTNLEMQKIEKEQGFEQSMAYVNNQLQQALQNNDFTNAKVLSQLQYDHQMKMHLDQMSLDKAKLALDQEGLDMAKIEQEYNKIQDLIQKGQLDPSNAVEYLQTQFADTLPEGFALKAPDPMATQKALEQDYLNQKYQYALAQGTTADGKLLAAEYDAEGKFTGLNDTFEKGFNSYMQKTIYGQTGSPLQADIISLKNGEIPFDQISDPADPRYMYLLEDTTVPKLAGGATLPESPDWSKGEVGRGSSSRTTFTALEGASFVNIGGTLWKVDGMSIQDRFGDDWSKYKLVNVLTGDVTEVIAK